MRKFLTICLLVFVPAAIMAQRQTPVIVIMADQLRTDALGAYTPNINALQKESVNFSRAYCAVPLCAPSRAAFFTGLYANHTGSLINPWEKADEKYGDTHAGTPSLYSLLEKDWDSYHVGKQHFFTEEKIDKNPQSLTHWITQEDYSKWLKELHKSKPGGKQFKADAPELVSGDHTQLRSYSTPAFGKYKEGIDYFLDKYIADNCIKAIRERKTDKPILLNAMFLAPHPPFSVPEPYYSMIDPQSIHLPDNVAQWYTGQSPLQVYNLTGFVGTRYSREQWRDIWAKYLGLVKLLDDQVGRVIQALKEAGIYDESIVIFTADHGEMLGSHRLWQKMCMYEESAKVPLMIKMPKQAGITATNTDALVSLIDVFPTILDYIGVKNPAKMDGQSLLPLLQGTGKGRTSLFIQYDGNGSLGSVQRCRVEGNLKLIADQFKDETWLELYDLSKDPQETKNLVFDPAYRNTAEKMLKGLEAEMKLTGDRIRLPDKLLETFLRIHTPSSNESDNNGL
ncbi:MAG TPA: sulfatase-like hydrolase/transferase [Sediminibacterium sp.]|nr:sulfatase-like hydrolase/transferase [Sediminibacterium sp.]